MQIYIRQGLITYHSDAERYYCCDRRARVETTNVQQQCVADFAKKWDPYDWTKQLG